LNYCNNNIVYYWNYERIKITFIIPSIGRDTLVKTVQSLKNQNNDNWKAIIVFDGIKPTLENDDDRITILQSEKLGKGMSGAGDVRNYGIHFVDTEWVAFLDDDDSISYDYVDKFLIETEKYKHVEILIFRMLDITGIIMPNLEADTVRWMDVGISFSAKRVIFDYGLIFQSSPKEDFDFLMHGVDYGFVMMVSPYVTYFVRNYDEKIANHSKGTRIIIANPDPIPRKNFI
jgi:glycosyltransferase involved in cell wall biosynthesis